MLTCGGRRAGRDARQAARRGEVCGQMPAVHDALAAGTLSAGHVDALARAVGQLDDAGRAQLAELESTLVESAATTTVEAFEREVGQLTRILSRDDGTRHLERLKRQRRVRRWIDRHSGMCHTHLELDPETDARVSAAFDAAVQAARTAQQDDVSFEHLRADALVDLITGARSTDRRVPEVVVLIDHDTLVHGVHPATVAETADGAELPVATIRRLACDADIIPIVLGGDGVPLDHGRSRRLATREQRRALRAMYRTCGHPGCEVRFEACRIHHVTWWEHKGRPTSPTCSRSANGTTTSSTKDNGPSPSNPTGRSPSAAPTEPSPSAAPRRRLSNAHHPERRQPDEWSGVRFEPASQLAQGCFPLCRARRPSGETWEVESGTAGAARVPRYG